jgi:hypothetical protein
MVEYRETCRTCEGVGTVAIESTLTYPEGDPEIKACAEYPPAGSDAQMLQVVACGSRDSGGVGESYVYRGMAQCSKRR